MIFLISLGVAMSELAGIMQNGAMHRKEFITANNTPSSLYTDDANARKRQVFVPKSPELRRRKYSLASVMRRLEKKTDENKETKDEIKERKLQKRELQHNSKNVKRGIFNLRSKQHSNHNNNNKACEEAVSSEEHCICLIPPVPCELGYHDLRIEEVEKPRSSSIIHASEDVLLCDVQRSPRSPRSPRMQSKQSKSLSAPSSPSPQGKKNHLSPLSGRRQLKSDSGYSENGEKSPTHLHHNMQPCFETTNAEIRTLAYSELGRVLEGKYYNPKQIGTWSKTITEELLLKLRRLTHRQKKIVVTVYIGEKFPGTVEVFVSCPFKTAQDNFQTVSIEINDIYAWVSVIGINVMT